ncbi:MAG TPA: alpha/beta hydrolase-fold protein [Longimicrobiaceae bacterium]|jgi:S-formylglutathione hydrolase FrmB
MSRPSLPLLLALLLLAGCAPSTAVPAGVAARPAAPARGTLVREVVRSEALRRNRLGDPVDRAVAVYLPPSYAASPRRRYPVVYLLHGFDGGPDQWAGERMRLPQAMDSLTAAGAVREMIVVMPDGRNAFGGSFFANSVSTGHWEDFLVRDVVGQVDRRFRTVRSPRARGIGGWSMGGHAALGVGARHPEVFGAVYALSPCCLGDLWADFSADTSAGAKLWAEAAAAREEQEIAGAGFHARLALAIAALASPDSAHPRWGMLLPYQAGPEGLHWTPPIHDRWSAVSPELLVARHRRGFARLGAIAFDAGTEDGFRHIPRSTQALAATLMREGIDHTFELYPGTHGSHVAERLRTRVLPFFSARLAAQPSGLR